MNRAWQISSKILAGLFVTAMYATPQAYTVSARPGAINYIEGNAFVDGQPISEKTLGQKFLNANDTLSTDVGKAEIALTPGVWVRIGDNSEVRLVSPSLTDTQVQVDRGEAMVEVAELVKDNRIQILDQGSSTTLQKTGLYRFTADGPPTAAVIDGKADVFYGDRSVELGKGHETVIGSNLKREKFDSKKEDDLYAWSNVRSEYDAAASYQTARNVTINNYGGFGYGGWGGYGFYGGGPWGYGFGPFDSGWFWNGMWNSWAWLPGEGAFFSPFGWGFYAPSVIAYAPVIYAPVPRTGGVPATVNRAASRAMAVPVNPEAPPAIGRTALSSPHAYEAARMQTARSFARVGGFATAGGGRVAVGGGRIGGSGGRMGGFAVADTSAALVAGT